jgi:DNA mismatch repair protein MutL
MNLNLSNEFQDCIIKSKMNILDNNITKIKLNDREKVRASSIIPTYFNVVEELILNSLDANSKSIELFIDVPNYYIEIKDKGYGMDLDLLGKWNITSKSINELTYGYRGESLAAICSLSNLEILSKIKGRDNNNNNTYHKKFNPDGTSNDAIITTQKLDSPGTLIIVRDLFNNIMVRQKCMKSSIEIANIKDFIYRMSILHYSVSFRVFDISLRKDIILLPIRESVASKFASLYGKDIMDKMESISANIGDYYLTGLISPPLVKHCHYNKSYQFIYVNNRSVPLSCKYFNKIDNAYINAILSNESGIITSNNGPLRKHHIPNYNHPCYVLQLSCPRDSYDLINGTNKSNVLFKDINIVKKCIYILLQRIFNQYCPEKLYVISSLFNMSSSELKEINDNNKDIIPTNKDRDINTKDIVPSNEANYTQIYNSNCNSIQLNQQQQPQKLYSICKNTIVNNNENVSISPQSKAFQSAFLESPIQMQSNDKNSTSIFRSIDIDNTLDNGLNKFEFSNQKIKDNYEYVYNNSPSISLSSTPTSPPMTSRFGVSIKRIQNDDYNQFDLNILQDYEFGDDNSNEKKRKINNDEILLNSNYINDNSLPIQKENYDSIGETDCEEYSNENYSFQKFNFLIDNDNFNNKDIIYSSNNYNNNISDSNNSMSSSNITNDIITNQLPYIVHNKDNDPINSAFKSYGITKSKDIKWNGPIRHQGRNKTIKSSSITNTIKISNNKLDNDFINEDQIDNDNSLNVLSTFPIDKNSNLSISSSPFVFTKDKLQDLKFIGVLNNCYILVKSRDCLLAIDQHAADERIKLESFEIPTPINNKITINSSNLETKNINIMIEIDINMVDKINNNCNILNTWGFTYEIIPYNNEINQNNKSNYFKNNNESISLSIIKSKLRLTSVPVIQSEPLSIDDFFEFINYLFESQQTISSILPLSIIKPPAISRILASKACRSAIKFGDILNKEQCIDLIMKLSKTNFPFQCAHGRPSLIPLINFKKSLINYKSGINQISSNNSNNNNEIKNKKRYKLKFSNISNINISQQKT